MPDGYVIWGAPDTGKTRLAVAIANALQRRGEKVSVLHTDLLRVTLRHCGIEGLESKSLMDEPLKAPAAARLPLEVHWAKARHDGYKLVIEGRLALGFRPSGSRVIVVQKPGVALDPLEIRLYADLVHKMAPLNSRFVDASQHIDELVLAAID